MSMQGMQRVIMCLVRLLLAHLLGPQPALKGEGRGDNANSKDTQSLGSCCHYRCSPTACPTTHACLQWDHTQPLMYACNLLSLCIQTSVE